MPRLSGFDVQSRLRSSHPGLPALFITASDDPALDRDASEAGGVRLLRKPFPNDGAPRGGRDGASHEGVCVMRFHAAVRATPEPR